MTPRSISIILPCYDEEASLEECYRRLCRLADGMPDRRFEFVFVDDASVDRTPEILRRLAGADPRVVMLRLARNRGHQAAVTAGLDYCRGDAAVIMDADLQDPPEVVPRMIELIEQGFDVVHAQRRTRAGETALKLATARLFYRAISRLSSATIVEDSGDFRAITRPVVQAARAFREPHRFLRGIFADIGFRQCVLRYDREERFAGSTKYPLRKMVRLAADATLSFSSAPIRAILWCALGLWAMSLVYLGWNLVLLWQGRTVPGWASIVLLMTVFTGLILASIAVVGLYVGRIFEQGQARPLYWLEEARNIDASEAAPSGPAERAVSAAILAARGPGASGRGATHARATPVFEVGAAPRPSPSPALVEPKA